MTVPINNLALRIPIEKLIFLNTKKSIKKEATSCIINLPKQINKGVTSKWILTQN